MGGLSLIQEYKKDAKKVEQKLSFWNQLCCCCTQKKKTRPRTFSSASLKRVKPRDLSGAFCEHFWNLEDISENYPTSNINCKNPLHSKGLNSSTAERVLIKNGANSLPEPKEISNFELFIRQFWNLLWALLIGASTLSLLQFFLEPSELVNLWITLILYGMIVVMCTISWYQEMEARKVVRGFQNLMPETCLVIRDGQETYISAHNVVVGDLIRIRSGNRVPADARMLSCTQLKLESSSITGEAEPNDYQSEEVAEGVTIFDAHNIAFNGSLCVDGEGLGLVIRVASNTIIGQIADLTTGQGGKKSRLEEQVSKYVKFLVILACTVAGIAFTIGGFVRNWNNVIGLLANGFLVCAIGMVPCGLPATVTSILTVIARRLANKKVYLKRLDICEALGQVGIIASDKTGTLTKNQMTVTDVWFKNSYISGLPQSKTTVKECKSVSNYDSPVAEILTCMTVCNSSNFLAPPIDTKDGKDNKGMDAIEFSPPNASSVERASSKKIAKMVKKNTTGSPSEVAMLEYVDGIIDVDALRQSFDIVFEIPFNSRRKWHMMIAKLKSLGNGQHQYQLLIKGASEILVEKCSRILDLNGEQPMDQESIDKFQSAYDVFAHSGRRVIGFAQKYFVADSNVKFSVDEENYPTDGLVFLGTCAIMDPPRDETAKAIEQCRNAGIRVFMVTGDHHLTATAIARQIGLIVDVPGQQVRGYEIIHGEKISNLSDREWDMLLQKKSLVFARTTPEQKLMIVEQCQKREQLIAMTGDGVNDAPALKKADIGIAMDLVNGSEVAKQASDIILMDDNFSSIVRAVQEGRVMYDNIKKLLAYTMPHSFPEVWPIIINFCFGWPVGITALQILCIDLGSEIFPGVAMAKEPIEGDVMSRPPRKMNKVLVSNTLLAYSYIYTGQIQSLGCLLSYCYVFWSHGINISDLWMSALTHWQKNGDIFYSNGRAFSVEEQLYIGRQATSAWQMGIVFGQFFNIWSARTRRMSLFKHGFLSNKSLLMALVVELVLINIYVYCPGFNEFIGGAPIPLECWGLVAAVGMFIFTYNEIRKWCIRKWPTNSIVRKKKKFICTFSKCLTQCCSCSSVLLNPSAEEHFWRISVRYLPKGYNPN
uniref:Cation-transporting P-type ATPase N-terminal domain-containing protein n=1 Tax=Ditylenchus dipsaci TaxID=166011 RepID=A0A915DYZ5_9BILA